jgi:benzoyl-CoA reductase/2-hydroxyglutaryl-CoA dehydratase subunit BcrC/BadD/HgdB
MDSFKLFSDSLGGNLSRKLLSTPRVYALAKQIFIRLKNFSFEASRMAAETALEQAAAAFRGENMVAWTSAFFPSEMVHAFSLIPFAPEGAAATAASLGMAPQLLRFADQMGFSNDACSFHRCAAAGTAGEYFPVPDMLLASSHLCDGAPQLFRYLGRRYGKPFYILDVPVFPGEAGERYLARQLKELVLFMEKTSGRKLTRKAIREAWENSNRAGAAQLRVNTLRRHLPSPMSGEDALGFVYLVLVGKGHLQTARIYETLARELAERVASGGPDPAGERFRLLWMHLRPYYKNDLLGIVESELKMRVAFEEINDVYWPPLDPERPFISLARKILSNPALGPARRRLARVKELAAAYRADGVIHFSHWGCRQAVGATVFLKDQLRKDGIPFLSLDGDCVDPNSFPPGQARTRLESFLELLEQRAG